MLRARARGGSGGRHGTPLEFERFFKQRRRRLRGTQRFALAIAVDGAVPSAGLGGQGEPLDGRGDAVALRALRRCLLPGGRLALSVPRGADGVAFNTGRTYGAVLWSQLMEGWGLIDEEAGEQHVWLMEPLALSGAA